MTVVCVTEEVVRRVVIPACLNGCVDFVKYEKRRSSFSTGVVGIDNQVDSI